MRLCSIVLALLLSFLDGSAQTPLRFQSSPVYHPPSYYPLSQRRLLLQLSATELHVSRNAELGLDAGLIHVAEWLRLSREPVIEEGFDSPVSGGGGFGGGHREQGDSGDAWIDRRDAGFGLRLLAGAKDVQRLRMLVLLGAYYAFEPEGASRDSALFYLKATREESRRLKESHWDRQALCLMAKYYVQGEELQRGIECFNECIGECRKDGDRVNEARAWAWRGLYTRYSAATTDDRIASLQKALALYRQLGDVEGQINVLTNIAYLDISAIQLKPGEELFKEALRLEDSIGFVYTHYTTENISMVTTFEGGYGEPLSYALQSVKTAEGLKDSVLWGTYYTRLADLYSLLDGKTADCSKWARKAFDRYWAEKDDGYLYVSLSYIIADQLDRHEAGQALALVRSVAKQQPPQSITGWGQYHFLLARCYDGLKQYDSAEVHTLEGARLSRKLALLHGTINNAYIDSRLGELYLHKGKYDKARSYFRRYFLEKFSGNNLETDLLVQQSLAKIDSIFGDYRGYGRHLQAYIRLQDSNFNVQGQRQAEELAVKYETDRKEQEILLRDQRIAMLQQADQLRQTRLRQALLVQRMTAAGIAVLLVIAVVLVRQSRQRKKMARMLERLVTEKEWLLKEVNHRVKNNLHTVISLLETQARHLDNEALEAIESSQHRIYAMSLIHQKIYQAGNDGTIEMSGYLREFIQYLRDSFGGPEGVRWWLDIRPLVLGLAQAVPVALVLNEAVTNAIKHAFPAGSDGEIRVRFGSEGKEAVLSVSDNGIGLGAGPERSAGTDELAADGFGANGFEAHGFGAENGPESLGIELMKGLSQELRGSLR
ncbi:MAG TPA: sensor histidine kinase, partial [Puia sp.]